jgi:hypothetical protein
MSKLTDKLKERLGNLFDLVTSKKALVTIAAAVLIVTVVKTTPAIVGIAALAAAYVLAQGYVDGKREE